MFRRLSLFHRIFLHGVLLIFALSVSVMLVFHLAGTKPAGWMEPFRRAASLLGQTLDESGRPTAAFAKQLDSLSYIAGGSAAVYTEDGILLGHAGDRLPEPLSVEEARALKVGQTVRHRGIARIDAAIRSTPPVYAVLLLHEQPDMLHRFIFGLLAGLAVIGAVSYPLARSIAKPVVQMTEAAARLKAGDLSARVPSCEAGELGALSAALNEMAAGLDARIRREKALLANVSHELRTPLARMRVALELAQEDTCPSETRPGLLTGIGADVKELETLVDNVLNATRLDFAPGETPPLKKEEVVLNDFLNRITERYTEVSRRSIQLEMAPDTVASVFVDRDLFSRVLANLFDNAEKYAFPDKPIILSVYSSDDNLVLEVRDQGPGVPDADLSRIFEPFYRCDESRSKDVPGVGLGLSLCRQIIEAHGGRIRAVSSGEGLSIRIELPRN